MADPQQCFLFQIPSWSQIPSSIPRQISTSLATLFHKSDKCVASRHESADALSSKNKFSVAIWRFFLSKKWAFTTEYSLCRKLAPRLRTFHPKKMTDTWELQAKRVHGTFLLWHAYTCEVDWLEAARWLAVAVSLVRIFSLKGWGRTHLPPK